MTNTRGLHWRLALLLAALFWLPVQAQTTNTVYRFWSDVLGTHFYTISEAERDTIIATMGDVWRYEGSAWAAYATGATSGTQPIYRFWNTASQRHFFTIDMAERDRILRNLPDWRYEDIAYYAFPSQQSGTLPIYRFWSDRNQAHFYTIDENEKSSLIAHAHDNGWRFEGVAWYALPAHGRPGIDESAARLEAMRGIWTFYYEEANYSDYYDFTGPVRTGDSDVPYFLLGTDQYGNQVTLFWVPDVSLYMLFNSYYDEIYAFDFIEQDAVYGCYYHRPTEFGLGHCYEAVGLRIPADGQPLSGMAAMPQSAWRDLEAALTSIRNRVRSVISDWLANDAAVARLRDWLNAHLDAALQAPSE